MLKGNPSAFLQATQRFSAGANALHGQVRRLHDNTASLTQAWQGKGRDQFDSAYRQQVSEFDSCIHALEQIAPVFQRLGYRMDTIQRLEQQADHLSRELWSIDTNTPEGHREFARLQGRIHSLRMEAQQEAYAADIEAARAFESLDSRVPRVTLPVDQAARAHAGGRRLVEIGGEYFSVKPGTTDVDDRELYKAAEAFLIEALNARQRGDAKAEQRARGRLDDFRRSGVDIGEETPVTLALQRLYESPHIRKALASGDVDDLNQAMYETSMHYLWGNEDPAKRQAAASLYQVLRAKGGTAKLGSSGPTSPEEKAALSTALHAVPVAGNVLSVADLIAGEDVITRQELNSLDYGTTIVAALLGGTSRTIGRVTYIQGRKLLLSRPLQLATAAAVPGGGFSLPAATSEAKSQLRHFTVKDPSSLSELRDHAKKVQTNKEKGELGELYADAVFERAGYDKLPSKVGSNNGFDGVYVKYNASGEVEDIVVDIIINESKFGSARLGTTTMGYKQMDPDWIEMNIAKMRRSKDPDVKSTGKLLYENLHLIRTKMNRLGADGNNRWSSDPGGWGK